MHIFRIHVHLGIFIQRFLCDIPKCSQKLVDGNIASAKFTEAYTCFLCSVHMHTLGDLTAEIDKVCKAS